MRILLDLDIINKHDIFPDDYTILYLIKVKEYDIIKHFWEDGLSTRLLLLQDKGFIKVNGETLDEIIFRDKGKRILKIQNLLDVESWIQDWRDLFPSGSRDGYPYKGDKQGCIKKMKEFIKNYPEFTKEDIFNATIKYVSEHKMKGFTSMQQAHYFIEKNKISNLAGLCESILERGQSGDNDLSDSNVTYI